jgi:WD40 repeat protein
LNLIKIKNPYENTRVFEGHVKDTSAVAFSSNGYLVASGDIEGNLKIWNYETMNVTKEKKVFSSKIIGLDFVDANKRLLIYGYGKG